MTRKRFTERQVITTLLNQGCTLICGCGCMEPIGHGDVSEVERDHYHQLALGGEDTVANSRYLKGPCHKRKSFGSKATSLGSDTHERAKTKRIRGENKQGPKKPIQNRGFQKAPDGYDPWTRKTRM